MLQQLLPLRVSKVELLGRLSNRTATRYGGAVTEAWLNDLIKDGLLFALERGSNAGRSPQYFATKKHYRRALQLKRLHFSGIKRRDALLVQLFVRGYSTPPEQVGDALRREYIVVITKISPKLRSSYFFNAKDLTPKSRGRLSKETGDLDNRFEDAGLAQNIDTYVDLIRKAGNPPASDEFFSGLFLFDREKKTFTDLIERILRPSPTDLQEVRNVFVYVQAYLFRPLLGNALLNGPEWVALILVIFLRLKREGFTLDQILGNLSNPENFARLAEEMSDAFGAG